MSHCNSSELKIRQNYSAFFASVSISICHNYLFKIEDITQSHNLEFLGVIINPFSFLCGGEHKVKKLGVSFTLFYVSFADI